MTDEPKNEAKKIIIDEDWKSQVESEREAAEKSAETAQQAEPQPESESEGPLPPATLTVLASSLYLQGMISLGLLPAPGAEKGEVRLDHAKHTIDTLQMLQEKTEGNRTAEETKELDEMLHQMRMAFVSVQQQGTIDQ